jgi:hypothetical protein
MLKLQLKRVFLEKQLQNKTVEQIAFQMGEKIAAQKNKFVGKRNGPAGPEEIAHVVDLCYLKISEQENRYQQH